MSLANNSFIGAVSGSLTVAGNWSLGHVPNDTECAVFAAANWSGKDTPAMSFGDITLGGLSFDDPGLVTALGLTLTGVTLLAATPSQTRLAIVDDAFDVATGLDAISAAATIEFNGENAGTFTLTVGTGAGAFAGTVRANANVSSAYINLVGTYSGTINCEGAGPGAANESTVSILGTATGTVNVSGSSISGSVGTVSAAHLNLSGTGVCTDGAWGPTVLSGTWAIEGGFYESVAVTSSGTMKGGAASELFLHDSVIAVYRGVVLTIDMEICGVIGPATISVRQGGSVIVGADVDAQITVAPATADFPAVGDVKDGVLFDEGTKEGTLAGGGGVLVI
jgi:hypothetical protein